jgi:hypothetical protein
MCMLRKIRCLHHRILTRQEVRAKESSTADA